MLLGDSRFQLGFELDLWKASGRASVCNDMKEAWRMMCRTGFCSRKADVDAIT
jgi:hypothetical protein